MDYMISATIKDQPIRLFAIDTTIMVKEAQSIHNTSPTATAALGRTMTAVAMMTMMLKNKDDKISAQFKSNGPAENIIVVGNSLGEIKGDIYNPEIYIPLNDLGKLDVAGAVGQGTLTIIKDLGLKHPYIGTIEIVSGEIAEDFTYYFAISEQVPSVVSLGVLVNPDESVAKAGGFMIQLMPGHDEELIKYIEKRVSEAPSITQLLNEGYKPEKIIELIFQKYDVVFTDKKEVKYFCDCNRDRFERGLISLGKTELEAMIRDDDKAEVVCHFCRKRYEFNREDLEKLIK